MSPHYPAEPYKTSRPDWFDRKEPFLPYEQFHATPTALGGRFLSIRPDGRIRLNADTTQLVKSKGATHVRVLWDAERSRLALKLTTTGDKGAYRISPGRRDSMADITARAFFAHLRWNAPRVFTVAAVWNEEQQLLECAEPLPKEFLHSKQENPLAGVA